MKRSVVTILLLYAFVLVNSQEIFPLNDACWTGKVTLGEGSNATSSLFSYVLSGDTTINDIKRSKAYFIPNIDMRDSILVGYIHLEGKVIYYHQDKNDIENLNAGHLQICEEFYMKDFPLYDFSLKEGEAYSYCGGSISVSSIDSVFMVDGTRCRRLTGLNWIEGMGNIEGLFSHVEKIPTSSGYSRELICFCHNGAVKYLGSGYIECPEPNFTSIRDTEQASLTTFCSKTDGFIAVSSSQPISRVRLLNINGVLLQEKIVNSEMQVNLYHSQGTSTGICIMQIILHNGLTVEKKLMIDSDD